MIQYSIVLIYVGFFGLIGFSLWVTRNPWCLLALVFMPSYNNNGETDE